MRAFRVCDGMTLQEVADKAGLTKGHLSEIEHGKMNVTLETLYRLARGLETTAKELVI